ncbi:hypothetical protein FBU30_008827 [Linnemannia zychae]|nr:hypothetical protein FBU30_008827 [Linnemannia zychae]
MDLTKVKSTKHGRGGSSIRGKPNGAKVSAPLPLNLPSRRHEKGGHDVSLVSSGSSWGSPSAPSTAVLGTASSTSSSPPTGGASPLLTAIPQGTGGDSPQPDAQGGSPFQKTTPRAWGAVAQSSDSNLAEYPTAAEAAKKSQEHQGEHHKINAATQNTTTNSNSAVKSTTPIPTSGEPMAKTVSAMSGGDNWDEVDDDEGVDFLNAEAIEFADGSVVVAAVVAQTTDTPKDEELQQPISSPKPTTSQLSVSSQKPFNQQTSVNHQSEEKIVERGDVDFSRSLPNRNPSNMTHSLYHHNHEQSSRYGSHDRSHSSLWQGGPSDRRSSSDRGQSFHSGQRRESFGSRDHSGPPRRESYDRREPPIRSGSYSRERDMPYRDSDYGLDRRLSHDRQTYGADRFIDRPQRDYQLLSRSKDGSLDRSGSFGRSGTSDYQSSYSHSHSGPYDRSGHSDRGGPLDRGGHHEFSPSGYRGYNYQQFSPNMENGPYDSPRSRDSHDSRLGSYTHLVPQGVVEYDRPAQVSEEQREAMKHSAEEARRRRQEEEAKYEEAKARAKAKADELAKKAEEAKLAKEKEEKAAKEKEEREAKEREELEAKHTKAKEEAEAERLANVPATVREFGDPRQRPHILKPSEEEEKEAMAKWQALPGRLAMEESERKAQVKEKRRLEEEKQKAVINHKVSSTSSNATTVSSTSAAGPWRRGQPLPKAKSDFHSQPESLSAPASKKDEKTVEDHQSSLPTSQGTIHKPAVEQLDKVMHRIEESFQSQGNSLQAVDANMKRPADQVEHAIQTSGSTADVADKDIVVLETGQISLDSANDKAPSKDVTKIASVSRGEKSTIDSTTWRKEDYKDSLKVESTIASDHSTMSNADETKVNSDITSKPQPIGNEKTSRSAVATYYKGNYPAKINRINGTAKIADITKIHARLSLQSAGDQILEPSNKSKIEGKAKELMKVKREAAKLGSSSKRNSLSASSPATIFPINVEKAARNRGSMSFMVESEIDPPLKTDIKITEEPVLKSLDTATTNREESTKEDSNQVSVQSLDESQQSAAHNQQKHGAPLPMDGSVNQHAQPIWGGTTGVEAGNQGGVVGAHTVIMAAPGVSGPHPPQPFSVMIPQQYYLQGYHQHPYFFQRPLAPPPPPHMNAFPGAAMHPPFGAVQISPADARGSPELIGQSQTVVPSGSTDAQNDVGSQVAASPSSSILGPHHWLPRFSVAGDAPPQQAIVSAGPGPFMVQAPTPQQAQANIMAAANINRVPQPRPYSHPPPMVHQQALPPHTLKQPGRVQTSGSASLESSFQEGSGSPTNADSWNSSAAITSNPTSTSPGNSGNRAHGPGQMHSWTPGTGRAPPMGGVGSGPNGTYGNYQPMPHHIHPGGGRGGRGNYSNFHPSREFRPRGGHNVGHMNQQQIQGSPSSYSYGHQQQQHGNQPIGSSSSVTGSVDSSTSQTHQPAHQHAQHLAATSQSSRSSHSAVTTPTSTNSLSF